MPRIICRIFAVLLTLTLAVGPVLHGNGASHVGVKMTVATSGDVALPGKCDGCGGDKLGVSPSTCFTYCSSALFLPVAENLLEDPPSDAMGFPAGLILTGHGASPDPYPPRPAVFSS